MKISIASYSFHGLTGQGMMDVFGYLETVKYRYRLDAIERAGRAGARRLSIGALLGLTDWRIDGFWTAVWAALILSIVSFFTSHTGLQTFFRFWHPQPGQQQPPA